MKKLINTSFVYAIAGLVGGVFYREFTKFSGFEGRTALSFVHVHLLVLGMFFFLLLALLEGPLGLTAHKRFKPFFVCYNLGLSLTALLLGVRGVLQVLYGQGGLSRGLDASISGIAGIGHILLGVGLILFFLMARSCAKQHEHAAVR